MAKKKDDYSVLILLLLLGAGYVFSKKSTGTAAVTFKDPAGNPISFQPEDGAISAAGPNGQCYRYYAAENSWYPTNCP